MDTKVARDTIQIIRKERKRRLSRLSDHPDVANQQWRYSDGPFVNDLCLMLMVAIHHQVERELVGFAARMAGDGKPISEEQYQQRVQVEREYWRNRNTKRKVVAKLKLMSFSEWDTSMETLRLLANSNKHHPSGKPDEGLLK